MRASVRTLIRNSKISRIRNPLPADNSIKKFIERLGWIRRKKRINIYPAVMTTGVFITQLLRHIPQMTDTKPAETTNKNRKQFKQY
jgi:hypothetical protein